MPASSRDERLLAAAALQGRVYQLVNAYRVRGHLFAKIDPLGTPPDAAPELNLSNFGLSPDDYDVQFPTVGIGGLPDRATLREIIAHLSETYCSSIGVEFKLWGHDTGGALSVVEHPFPVGALVPPHLHTR